MAQTPSEISALRVLPQKAAIYVGEECMFSLIIPSVEPADVQTETPSFPADVSFTSLRRTDYIDKGMLAGTEIDLWLTFRELNAYELPPLVVKIKNRMYRIPFEHVNITRNPATIDPSLIIRFDNGIETQAGAVSGAPLFEVHAGDKICFTIYLQYAVQIINFEWQVPKNAILSEILRYEITEGKPRGGSVPESRVPVARFEWQPLSSGNVPLPDIKIMATAYSGARFKLTQPQGFISVVPPEQEQIADYNDDESYFSYAFTKTDDMTSSQAVSTVSSLDCENLAMLRMKERHALLPWKAAATRRTFEKKLGIPAGHNEPSCSVCILFAAVFVFFALSALLAFLFRNRIQIFLFVILACGALAGTAVTGARTLRKYGIYKGGEIRSVPDESAELMSPIERGSRVRIEENAGKWIYIQYGSTGGWVLSASVIVIQ